MASSKRLLATASFVIILSGILLGPSLSAFAYTACNREGDCWHTDTRVHFPGVKLSFHNDKWADSHRSNSHYKWHDTDNDHDWHHGYWSHGEWHPS